MSLRAAVRPSLVVTLALPFLAVALGGCSKGSAAASHNKGDAVIPVVTSLVEERAVPLTVNVVGTVESTGTVALQSRVDGQITEVFVRDGDEVKAGQRLLQIDPVPFQLQLRMAQATLARDEAKLENAKAKANHGAALQDQHYISQDDYTQLRTDMDGADATVEQDRAALDNAKLQLSYATITAPVAGKIGHIAQQVGNTIHASAQTPLTTLNVIDTVDVNFALPEQQLSAVRRAIAATKSPVRVKASTVGMKDDQSAGDLVFIDNAADPTTGTIRLRARFDNRKRALWPGQLVDVVIDLPTVAALVIPDAAVSENSEGSYVFVIKDGSIAEQRQIQVLRTTDDFAVVDGLHVGDQVVVDGQSRLMPNARVKVQPGKAAA
ncbi:MAG TPA: efflux RND transporter periplasmic adaptor subunit [Steroidobacteraceae bacterium]|jgi:multidrug efflux system membrane fusion protein